MVTARQAFEALVIKLEHLYGQDHAHDFQQELDALDAAIGAEEAALVKQEG